MTKIVLTGPLNSKTNKPSVCVGGVLVWRRYRVSYVIWGVQLAYRWPSFVAGKDRGECFVVVFFLRVFTFIIFPLFSLSLSFVSSTIVSFSFLPYTER